MTKVLIQPDSAVTGLTREHPDEKGLSLNERIEQPIR